MAHTGCLSGTEATAGLPIARLSGSLDCLWIRRSPNAWSHRPPVRVAAREVLHDPGQFSDQRSTAHRRGHSAPHRIFRCEHRAASEGNACRPICSSVGTKSPHGSRSAARKNYEDAADSFGVFEDSSTCSRERPGFRHAPIYKSAAHEADYSVEKAIMTVPHPMERMARGFMRAATFLQGRNAAKGARFSRIRKTSPIASSCRVRRASSQRACLAGNRVR